MTIDEEYGGAGLDATASVLLFDALSYSDPGFALAVLAHSILFAFAGLYYAMCAIGDFVDAHDDYSFYSEQRAALDLYRAYRRGANREAAQDALQRLKRFWEE